MFIGIIAPLLPSATIGQGFPAHATSYMPVSGRARRRFKAIAARKVAVRTNRATLWGSATDAGFTPHDQRMAAARGCCSRIGIEYDI